VNRSFTGLPPFRALRAFNAVAQFGSVSLAAGDLQVSPGAISQQVRLLERHLGLRLLERSGRGVALTAKGLSYHRKILIAFDTLLQAQRSLVQSGHHAEVTVSALPSLVTTWLSPCLFEFREHHQEAVIRLIGSDVEPRTEERIDIRITYGHRVRAYSRFTKLFVDSVVPVCSPALARTASLATPADLLRLPLIHIEWEGDFTPAPTWSDWFRSVGIVGVTIPPGLICSLSSVAIGAAIAGRGLALAQISMVAADLKAGRLMIPFEQRLPLPDAYFMTWNSTALKNSHGSALLSWLIAAGHGISAQPAGY